MIKVLSRWDELRDSYRLLVGRGLPLHQGIGKLWDFGNLVETFGEPADVIRPIVDLGSGTFRPGTVDLLAALGYTDIVGVDQYIPRRIASRSVLKRAVGRSVGRHVPIRFARQDITRTDFPDQHFQHAICLSVIEHGPHRQPETLLREARRIVRDGGLFYLSTDYWPEHDIPDRMAGVLPMHVFDRGEILSLLDLAEGSGWRLLQGTPDPLPTPEEKVVCYAGAEYTFISMVFEAA